MLMISTEFLTLIFLIILFYCRMSGFQIPLELKIDFLENVVLPSFGVSLENGEPRNNWMRMRANGKYQPHLEDLILGFNWIHTWDKYDLQYVS